MTPRPFASLLTSAPPSSPYRPQAVADRDPDDQPLGIPYEISGESCIPGIVCDDVAAIFEEHKIVPALDPFVAQDGFAFSRGDNTFSFGPVIAEMVPEASGHGEEDDAAAAPASLAARSGGVSAKFKISNSSKVPCSVDFTLTPKVDGGATDETFPMEVHPSRLDVPPHEHRYVTTYFAPVAIGTFAATFEAPRVPPAARLAELLAAEPPFEARTLAQLVSLAPHERRVALPSGVA